MLTARTHRHRRCLAKQDTVALAGIASSKKTTTRRVYGFIAFDKTAWLNCEGTPAPLCAGSDRMLIIARKRGIRPDVGLGEIFVRDIVSLPYLTPMRPIS